MCGCQCALLSTVSTNSVAHCRSKRIPPENGFTDNIYAADLVGSTGVSGFQSYKLAFCIYNKLHLQAEISS